MNRLRPLLTTLLIVAAVAGLGGGYYALERLSAGREEIVGFWAGVAYAVVVACFIGLSLAVLQFIALNAILYFAPGIDFEGLKIPILAVEALLCLLFAVTLIYLLPLRFHDL